MTLPRRFPALDPARYTGELRDFAQDLGLQLDWLYEQLVTGLAPAMFVQNGVGAIARPVLDKLLEAPASPQDFGAVGNNVVDDYPAIQTLFDRASEGTVVVLPRPSVAYRLTQTPTITKSLAVQGASSGGGSGSGGGIRLNQAGSVPALTVNCASSAEVVVVENLVLSGGTIGLNLIGAYLSRFSRFAHLAIQTQVATGRGLVIGTGMIGAAFDDINLENTGEYGLFSEGADLLGTCVLSGIRATGATIAGVHLKETSGSGEQPCITFVNPIFEGNVGRGLSTYDVRVLLVNPWFESNGSGAGEADIYMDGSALLLNEVRGIGGYFSNPHAAQANRRVFFNQATQRLILEGTRFGSGQIIDANNKTSSVRIVLIAVDPEPTINNYAGSYAKYKPNGFEVTGTATIKSTGSLVVGDGTAITKHLSATQALDFASIAAGATAELSIAVTGAAAGDACSAVPSGGLEAGLVIAAVYAATNAVTVRLYNSTGGAIDPASRLWRGDVWKH